MSEKKKLKKYVVPQTKEELIAAINAKGISDIICTSNTFDGEIEFSIEIRTKDKKSFHFGQSFVNRPLFDDMQVLDMTTGNCYGVEADMGKGFDSRTYDYSWSNNSPWSLAVDEDA